MYRGIKWSEAESRGPTSGLRRSVITGDEPELFLQSQLNQGQSCEQ